MRYQFSCTLSQLLLPGLRNADSSRIIIGILLTPILWLVISIQAQAYLNSPWLGLLVIIALPMIAQFTFIYSQESRKVFSYLKYRYYLKVYAYEARLIKQTYRVVLYIIRKSSQAKVLSVKQ